MKFSTVTIIFLLMLFRPFYTKAQKPFHISFTTEDYKSFIKKPKVEFKDSLELLTYLKVFRAKALSEGYLTASVDAIDFQKKNCQVNFHLGEKFNSIRLILTLETTEFLKKEGQFKEKFLTNQSFRAKEIGEYMTQIHQSMLNSGYPFSKVSLTDVVLDTKGSSANLAIEKNQRLKWKEIHVKGDTAVSLNYISSLLQIKVGDWHNESVLGTIAQKIEQVPFLTEIKSSEYLFTSDGVELFLYLKSRPMSSANGFVGLQPDLVQGGYFLTGELALKLLNTLKTGELIDLKWQNLQTQTQQLKVQTNFPFLFKSPFGLDGKFNLYKRDSTFLDLKGRAALQYHMKGGNFISFYYERIASSLLSGSANNTSFTGLANIKSNNYGVALIKRKVDYLPNPRTGYSIDVSSSVGQRQSQKKDTSLVERSLVFKGESDIEYFLPVAKRHVFRLANHTSFLSTPNIFQNELYRFGGLTTQRGFNEQEIFASTYTTFSLEYRFLFDKNSRAFLFYDHSFYERNSEGYQNDYPFGFGAGFSFGTQIGIFSIQYALGSQQNNPILFKNGKIHFGYIAYF